MGRRESEGGERREGLTDMKKVVNTGVARWLLFDRMPVNGSEMSLTPDGAEHRLCIRTHKTVNSLRELLGRQGRHWIKFWCHGVRLKENVDLHKCGVGLGSKVFETVQIYLKLAGGNIYEIDVALHSTTLGQLRHIFVNKLVTVKAGIGVSRSFTGWNYASGTMANRETQERIIQILDQRTNPDNFRLCFKGKELSGFQGRMSVEKALEAWRVPAMS